MNQCLTQRARLNVCCATGKSTVKKGTKAVKGTKSTRLGGAGYRAPAQDVSSVNISPKRVIKATSQTQQRP